MPTWIPFHDLASLAGLLLAAAIGYFLWYRQSKLPPGPKGVPFFGLSLVDKTPEHFVEWGKKYGDLMYINAFGQGGVLVANSVGAVVDLFDRRGSVYRHRPPWIATNVFLTRGLFLTATDDEELWRKGRRAAHESINKNVVSRYWDIQRNEALIMTENLLRDSTNWYEEVHRFTISSILSALYNIPPTLSWGDPLITKLNEFEKTVISASFPGNSLVEYFTWMRYLPDAISPWKRRAKKFFAESSAMFMTLFRNVEKRMEAGDEMYGLVGHTIRQQQRLGLSDLEASWIPAPFITGGVGTTETLLWMVVAMVAFPETQKKCQEELDAVVGRSRTPMFEDKDNLPYIRATIRELLRWRATAPIGVPHSTKQDDWYKGYLIPKGTVCCGHSWMLNHDPNVYGEDVDTFNPSRFIGEDGKLLPAAPDTKDGHHTYGFGPRLCPGRYYANDTLFIALAQLLWATNISPIKDEKTGKPFIPDPTSYIGTTKRPPPFPCLIKPRFPEATEMVMQARELLG